VEKHGSIVRLKFGSLARSQQRARGTCIKGGIHGPRAMLHSIRVFAKLGYARIRRAESEPSPRSSRPRATRFSIDPGSTPCLFDMQVENDGRRP